MPPFIAGAAARPRSHQEEPSRTYVPTKCEQGGGRAYLHMRIAMAGLQLNAMVMHLLCENAF